MNKFTPQDAIVLGSHNHRVHSSLCGDTYRREYPKIGRNEPCPCNSGKKYKKCHGDLNNE